MWVNGVGEIWRSSCRAPGLGDLEVLPHLRLFLEGKEGKYVITVCSCFENGKYFN